MDTSISSGVTADTDPWPALPFPEWKDTNATLHMWTQIVGKTLYLTARGTGLGTALFIACLFFATACTDMLPAGSDADQHGKAGMQRVTGTVFYRERMLLPPGAVVEVSLRDVSRADAPARLVARQIIEEPPAPPIPFVLKYDSAKIDPRMSYAVRAVVRYQGRLLFTSDTHYPVITRGAGNTVDILVKRVAGATSKPDASLENTYWKLVSLAGERYQHKSKNREPHLILRSEDNIASGFGGCNAFTGNFEMDGSMLRFGNLAVTLRACPRGMQIETGYLSALGEVNRYVIQGDTMRLYHDDKDLLGFEAVYF
jgi:putative lipoprotein